MFAGGEVGQWLVEGVEPVTGASLPAVSRLAIADSAQVVDAGAAWPLRGLTSNTRYTQRSEQEALVARQAGLGRPEATRAALIPITKSEAWWALAQDERRAVFEETSHHIAIGLEYLPAIARRLYHGRDLDEPFDFLTWFEYAPEDAPAFEDLVARLRTTRRQGTGSAATADLFATRNPHGGGRHEQRDTTPLLPLSVTGGCPSRARRTPTQGWRAAGPPGSRRRGRLGCVLEPGEEVERFPKVMAVVQPSGDRREVLQSDRDVV